MWVIELGAPASVPLDLACLRQERFSLAEIPGSPNRSPKSESRVELFVCGRALVGPDQLSGCT